MSDDPLAPRPAGSPTGVFEHWRDYQSCNAWGGWGFPRGKTTVWPDDGKVTFYLSGHGAPITIPIDAEEIVHVENPKGNRERGRSD